MSLASLKQECELRRQRADEEDRIKRVQQKLNEMSGRGRDNRRKGRSRSRSPSKSRSRSRSPFDRGVRRNPTNTVTSSKHTNSDDPELLRSRVFLGNLPTDKLEREEISDMFSKYGKILAVSVLRGYGFVQYMHEADAREAVRMENGGLLKGNKLDVKMAAEGRKKSGERRESGPKRSPVRERPRARSPERDTRDRRERSTLSRDRDRDPYDDPYRRLRDPYDRRPPPPDPYDDPYRRPPPPPPVLRDPYYDRYADPYRRDPYAPPPPLPLPAPDPYSTYPYGRDPYTTQPEYPPHECQIFMLTNTVRSYAEMLERRLAVYKMLCNIRLLPEDLPPTKAMEDLSRRRIPYAITINAQNEVHRSITLNILHGTPQEHRNMPLEDALTLISKKFEDYVREIRERGNPVGSRASEDILPPTPHVHYLLNLLVDNRFLKIDEIDSVINYLKERRKRLEERRGGTEEKAIDDQQAKLQNKILDILNGDQALSKLAASVNSVVSRPIQQTPPAPVFEQRSNAAPTSINFDNPSVQKALDNLIQSGPALMQSINAISSSQPPPAALTTSSYDAPSTAPASSYSDYRHY